MPTEVDSARAALTAAIGSLKDGAETVVATVLLESRDGLSLEPRVINATDELLNVLKDAALEWLANVGDDEMVPYEGGYEPTSNQTLRLAPSEVAMLVTTRAELQPPDAGHQFTLRRTPLSRIRGYSFSAKFGDGDWLHLFRLLTRSSLQLTRQRSVQAIFVNNQYALMPEEGLRFETDFDAALVGEHVLIRHRSRFERLFNFAQLSTSHATASAEAVVAGLKIRGVADFIRVVAADQRMHSKLASAQRRLEEPGYRAKVTTASIANLIGSRSDVDLKFEGKGEDLELIFDGSPQRRWTLLKVLDDDFLISELTDSRYQAPSKLSGSA